MRQWREIHLNDTSYFVGHLYGDILGEKRDGSTFVTGFKIQKLDRGDYYLVKTAGAHVYLLYKDKEWQNEAPQRKIARRY